MGKRIRIKDIAEKAKVSTGTVDRVIHNRGNVSPEKRAKVKSVMEELGYEPNIIARTLATRRVLHIALLLPDPSIDPYWELPNTGVEKAWQSVRHYGVELEPFYFNLFDQADFAKKAAIALKAKPEAIVFPPVFLKAANELLQECACRGITVSLFNTELSGENVLTYVGQNSYQSGVLAGKLLSFSMGQSDRVAVVNLSKEPANAKHLSDKARGLEDYFETQGLGGSNRVEKVVFEEFEDKAALRAFLLDLLQAQPELKGFFVTNSRAYKIIDALGPEALKDMRIVGFDLLPENIAYLQKGAIQFLINQNPVEQGYLSLTSLVQKLIFDKKVEPIQYLPLDIVVAENARYYLEREEKYALVV
ncbi:MAG: LacI family DNA-binding transcriptional regulator [Phaeodactylibacter sp.]|uniref:LacI family DNA-binding transcriptional regulator n=1 Tax=Phaeodactylibacter sp. TaxID=1940289 RepID=UPI0032ED0E12